ncbi:hypothetical protein HMPREF0673_02066 [Leyella stercorea DSM 18206]|uniref:Uncharacterized protein n=2 Tax=Leyella stercorea TaxID=363265 RepID=G6AZK1_9BACT|nr:hypothetical protein HMPREF0673_02066 [Leyella stercorea DSM 18206]
MMSMRFFRKICFVATLLLFALPMVAATIDGGGKIEKKVWQDSDPSKENYFNNRRALVGPGCTINSIGDGVKVVSGTANLQNLCNDDLDDYATIPALANVTVVGNPIISVKDNQHCYAGGTEAGFVICAKSEASILTLDLAKFYKIQFLKDGKAVGELQKISTGNTVTGLGLSLLTILGSDQVNKLYMATAPGNFDEIKLVQCGVDVQLGTAINIKYAFVGKAREYTITNNKENGIAKYAQEQGRKNITLDCDGVSHLVSKKENVIDEDLTNSFDINALNLVLVQLGSRPIKVIAKPSDNQEAFPANTEVGFKYASSALLNLKLGDGIRLTFFNKEGTEIGHKVISTTVLGLGLIKKSTEAELVMKAPWDFSAVKMSVEGLNAGLTGTNKVYYAFVRMAPDAASHHCPINATSSRDVSGSVNQFQLQHNDTVQVKWSIVDRPTGSNVELNTETGLVSNLDIPGKYVFKATVLKDEGRSEKCYEETTLNYAPKYVAEEHGVNILVNKEGEEPKYMLSDKFGGGLIQIFDRMMNCSAILTTSLNDFAYREPGVEVAANKGLVGIKTADGSNFADGLNGNARAFNGKMKVGFVVSAKATGLDADVLKLYNIKLYNKGKEVTGDVTTHWDAISAGLIGKEETRKMCLNVEVPAGSVFDEIVLYNTDVLSADLSQLNIYYAYVADADADNATINPVYGAQVVSTDNTNASIDFANTQMVQVANIGNGYNELSNLIDDSMDTYLTLPLGVDLGGSTISVNMGKVVDKGQQLVMVTQNLALGLGASLGEGLKLTTYLDDEKQEELTSWKVLGADVIGSKGDSYAVLNPTKSFDQVRITPVKALSALENLQIKGFALRTDMNDDGTINGDDLLVLDEDKTLAVTKSYTGAKMLLHRTFTKSADNNKKGWNSIILPVDMTAAQVKEAFGEGVQMAEFDRLDNNWIKFSTVNVAADGVVLHKNTPYIIYPTKEPLGNYSYTIDGVTKILDGHVYVANGINYDDQTSNLTHTVNGGGMTYTGSYSNPTTVSADSYMFSKGDLIHTIKSHDVKAYRCWLKEDMHTGKMLMFSINGNGIDGTTGIHVIEENKQNTNTGIYNLGGVCMNTNNVDKLPKGVYVVNNKVVVKK